VKVINSVYPSKKEKDFKILEKHPNLKTEELGKLKSAFRLFDKDGNESISLSELKDNLKHFGFSGASKHTIEDIEKLMKEYTDSELDLDKFIHFTSKIDELKGKWINYDEIAEKSLQGRNKVYDIWDKALLSVNKNIQSPDISWETFKTYFYDFIGLHENLNSSIDKYFAHAFGVEQNLLKKSNLNHFLELFSALLPVNGNSLDGGKIFVNSIVQLYEKPYYFGILDRNTTEKILDAEHDKQRRNVFLVRISTSEGYKFCLSFKKEKCDHMIIHQESFGKIGILTYIDEKSRDLDTVSVNIPTQRENNLFRRY